MNDRRLTPANTRVAALELQGSVDAPKYVKGDLQSITACIADLRAAPDGKRDLGETKAIGFPKPERYSYFLFN